MQCSAEWKPVKEESDEYLVISQHRTLAVERLTVEPYPLNFWIRDLRHREGE